jgi:hypothetical protein
MMRQHVICGELAIERERTLEWMELRTRHPGKVQASEAAAEDGDSSALLRVGICSYRPNE